MMTGNNIFLVVLMAIAAAFMGMALSMEYIQSKLIPVTVAAVILVLAAIELAKAFLKGNKERDVPTEAEGDKSDDDPIVEWQGYLRAGIWLGSFFLAIYLLGFPIAIALYILAYTRSHGTGWAAAVSYAAGTTAVVYFLFGVGLGMDLHHGSVFTWLGF